jgi:hypothetical protein
LLCKQGVTSSTLVISTGEEKRKEKKNEKKNSKGSTTTRRGRKSVERTKRKKSDCGRWAKIGRRARKGKTSLGIERRRSRSIENTSTKSMCRYRKSTIRDSMVPTIRIASTRNGIDGRIARGI